MLRGHHDGCQIMCVFGRTDRWQNWWICTRMILIFQPSSHPSCKLKACWWGILAPTLVSVKYLVCARYFDHNLYYEIHRDVKIKHPLLVLNFIMNFIAVNTLQSFCQILKISFVRFTNTYKLSTGTLYNSGLKFVSKTWHNTLFTIKFTKLHNKIATKAYSHALERSTKCLFSTMLYMYYKLYGKKKKQIYVLFIN